MYTPDSETGRVLKSYATKNWEKNHDAPMYIYNLDIQVYLIPIYAHIKLIIIYYKFHCCVRRFFRLSG